MSQNDDATRDTSVWKCTTSDMYRPAGLFDESDGDQDSFPEEDEQQDDDELNNRQDDHCAAD